LSSSQKKQKKTGLRYAVRFDSNVGNLPLMAVDASALLGGVGEVRPLVEGALPSSAPLSGLPTGLAVYTRSVAATSLNGVGYGNASSGVAVAVPSTVPEPPLSVDVALALNVDEVQSVTIGATRIPEVQRITTTSEVGVDCTLSLAL
jgi:hypothetical protein